MIALVSCLDEPVAVEPASEQCPTTIEAHLAELAAQCDVHLASASDDDRRFALLLDSDHVAALVLARRLAHPEEGMTDVARGLGLRRDVFNQVHITAELSRQSIYRATALLQAQGFKPEPRGVATERTATGRRFRAPAPGTVARKILDAIAAGKTTLAMLVRDTGAPTNSVAPSLNRLVSHGLVCRPRRGVYELPAGSAS